MCEYLPGGPHSARSGSVATNYLFIGFRPNCTFGELIAVTEDETMFAEWLEEQFDEPLSIVVGYDAYAIVQPGNRIHWDVFERSETVFLWVGDSLHDDFIADWFCQHNPPRKRGVR